MGYLDNDGVLYLWAKIKAYVTNTLSAKVDTVDGKALSSNDFTDTYKTKLDGIDEGANKYTHPSYTEVSSGLYKITVDSTGHVSATTAVTKSDITDLGISDGSTEYSTASTTSDGLMSSSDKSKLDAFGEASTYALKTDISGVYIYKGSVSSESDLPTDDIEVGHVYDIQTSSSYGGAGMNVAWNGTNWDALGEVFSVSSITNTEIDTICV